MQVQPLKTFQGSEVVPKKHDSPAWKCIGAWLAKAGWRLVTPKAIPTREEALADQRPWESFDAFWI